MLVILLHPKVELLELYEGLIVSSNCGSDGLLIGPYLPPRIAYCGVGSTQCCIISNKN